MRTSPANLSFSKLPLFAQNQAEPDTNASGELAENSLAKKPAPKKLFDRPANTPTAPKVPKQSKSHKASQDKLTGIDGLMDEQKSMSVYGLAMLVLILLILWTGVLTVKQVQDYHAQYSDLQKLKREHRKLEIEHQRLLIEQQTFSATPQIAKRAVAELNMYYPQLSDRLILQANPTSNVATSETNRESDVANPPTIKPDTSNHTTRNREAGR